MPLRRRAWLTREGWYYATVLAFIIGGAVLRSINLLVILAGMMIATLLFNWRLAMASLSGLVVRRRLPEQVLAGEPLTVEITIENTRWWMSSWLLVVEDWVERTEGNGVASVGSETVQGPKSKVPGPNQGDVGRWTLDVGLSRFRTWLRHFMRRPRKTRASTVISHVPARGQTVSAYRLTLHRRGRYRFGPLRVSTRFPLALVRGQFTLPARAECLVIPRIGRLLPEWNRLLDAELAGDRRRHPQRGHAEGDYYGLRPWQSGDSLRWVHWRTTAKLGRPVVRQFERRRSRDVALVLDPWQPASPSPEDAGRMELAVSLTATVVNDVTGQGNSRLVVAIGGLEGECYAGPSSPLFCQEVLAHLAEVAATGDYAVGDLVQKAFDAAGPESRLIIISTRSADAPSLASAAAELPLDPDELVWINTGSAELSSLFVLE